MARRKRKGNLLLPIAIILAIGLGAWGARRPWIVASEQREKASAMRKELKSLRDKEISDREKRARAKNPNEMEEAARREGYRGPGEKPL